MGQQKVLQVDTVKPGSPAAELGIEPGDIVRAYNNVPISSNTALSSAAFNTKEKQLTEVPLVLGRGLQKLRLKVPTESLGIEFRIEFRGHDTYLESAFGPGFLLGKHAACQRLRQFKVLFTQWPTGPTVRFKHTFINLRLTQKALPICDHSQTSSTETTPLGSSPRKWACTLLQG